MKISKIYSNNILMEPIIFNRGFNVVYGDVEDVGGVKNEHNLGKTSLIYLIDFLLLKKITKSHFLSKYKKKFKGWIFYIEIELDDNKFLTIKRSVDNPTQISFKEHLINNQDFSLSDEWDKKDTKLFSKKELDSVSILENYLNFSVFKNYSFRHFLSYILRTQYDYGDIFKMKQFDGLDVDWKPQLFSMLGYSDENVINKYRLQYEIKSYQNILKTITGNKKYISSNLYNLRAAIAEKERERIEIIEQSNKFDFYVKEKKLNKELIENIETKISRLNSERYRLNVEINRIKESLQDSVTFNLDEVKRLFDQANIYFPDQLRKDYEDLIDFNKSLSIERAIYLKEDLAIGLEHMENIDDELKKINQEKEHILSFLRETDTFVKYKSFQQEILKIDDQINNFRLKLESLGTAENYNNKIESLNYESKEIASKIKETIDNGSKIFDLINETFKDIFKKIMNLTALLIVKPNKEGNPDFESIILDNKDDDQLTGQGDGYSAKKIQCASFILAILSVYNNERFFKFAYHDGVVEGYGDNPKVNFFTEARKVCKEKDIQYIISIIKSDVPNNFNFNDGEIIKKLTEEKPLFGFNF